MKVFLIEQGIKVVVEYAKSIICALNVRLDRPEKELLLLMKDVFLNWTGKFLN